MSRPSFDAVDPATGVLLRSVPIHTPEEAAGLVRAAADAFPGWASRTFDERAGVMRRAADLLDARADALAERMAEEMGKPIAQGRAEARKCAWVCRHYAERAASFLADEPVDMGGSTARVVYRPLGVVLAVMPWNFPLWQVFRFAAPAWMAGNVAVLKHAPSVPGCAEDLVGVMRDAGLPDGVLVSVRVPDDGVAALIADPRVAAVTLTGSTRAGRAVAAEAGRHLKPSVLELGGSDPVVVLEDADLDAAAEACATSRLLNGGQSCIAAKRMVVVDAVHDRFLERFVARMGAARMGDPRDDVELGPLARVDLRDALHDQVTRAVAAGARLVLGGRIPDGPGAWYPPTVLADVPEGNPAVVEELFGPVAAVQRARDEADALRLANATPYGLGAAVFTGDPDRGRRIAADVLQAGACFVNGFVKSDPRLPFGGIKQSGFGRELGVAGIRAFVNVKAVW